MFGVLERDRKGIAERRRREETSLRTSLTNPLSRGSMSAVLMPDLIWAQDDRPDHGWSYRPRSPPIDCGSLTWVPPSVAPSIYAIHRGERKSHIVGKGERVPPFLYYGRLGNRPRQVGRGLRTGRWAEAIMGSFGSRPKQMQMLWV